MATYFMQSMLSANEMELQQHEPGRALVYTVGSGRQGDALNWSSQLSPGVLGRKDGTSSGSIHSRLADADPRRGDSHSLLQIWRSRWYVVPAKAKGQPGEQRCECAREDVHGVSPTALVYQSSAFPAQVVFPESAGLTRAARARAAASVDGRGIQSM